MGKRDDIALALTRQDTPFALDRTGDLARAAGVNDINSLQRYFAANPLPPPYPTAPPVPGAPPQRQAPPVHGGNPRFLPTANDANFVAGLATVPPSTNVDDRRNIIPGLNREYFRLRDD
jgi:hypothetical protein